MKSQDNIEVFRKAHELIERHGVQAHQHASKLANAALEDGRTEEHKFWKDVAACLKLRVHDNSNI